MAGRQGRVFVDEAITSRIENIFSEAKNYVVVISPWLDFSASARAAIEECKAGEVDIFFVVSRLNVARGNHREALDWLQGKEIPAFEANRLHAKVYMNESTVFVTSRNLTDTSRENREVAYEVTDAIGAYEIRRYALNLMRDADSGFWGCARCLKPIAPDLKKPLCFRCWLAWEQENARYDSTPPVGLFNSPSSTTAPNFGG